MDPWCLTCASENACLNQAPAKRTASEDSAFLGPVLVEPDTGRRTRSDSGPNDSALLPFYDATSNSARASADPDDGSGTTRTFHPSVLLLVIQNARTVEQRDPAISHAN